MFVLLTLRTNTQAPSCRALVFFMVHGVAFTKKLVPYINVCVEIGMEVEKT